MTIVVPKSFADSIRHKRLLALSLLAIASYVLALFWDADFGYAGAPMIAYIALILLTYRLPLLYRLAARGICLTTAIQPLSIPLSLAINFWIVWPFDCIAEISHTHFGDLPAILIRTRMNRRGFLLPILRSDAEPVALFLKSANTGTGANAFSR
jgi:hypothetical protein